MSASITTPTGAFAARASATFHGSTPADATVAKALGIPAGAKVELIEWTLTLDGFDAAAGRYTLGFRYGLTVPNTPGLGRDIRTSARQGSWRATRGTRSNPAATVYELDQGVSLLRITGQILHVLNSDRSLMVGNGGWSYTLNSLEGSEPRVDPSRGSPELDEARTISAVSTGSHVFGVFEGRTPCQGTAREMSIRVSAGCAKVKWRITLFHDPATRKPTTYKVEGTLLRSTAREGDWTLDRAAGVEAASDVYRLQSPAGGTPIFLLRGDDNVLFMMTRDRRPLVGNADFSYTLDRRRTP